jgi:hypothetical protein
LNESQDIDADGGDADCTHDATGCDKQNENKNREYTFIFETNGIDIDYY